MQDIFEYLGEEEFIIWNSELGFRDFVSIGEVDSINKKGWLDDPYDMVGPFCLDELCNLGQISFEACVVMSEEYWKENRILLQEESIIRQKKLYEDFYQNIHENNQRKKDFHMVSEKEHRKLLCLPLEGTLEISQIKIAYRKVVKKAHPDVGGSHEKFIQITEARDVLLKCC